MVVSDTSETVAADRVSDRAIVEETDNPEKPDFMQRVLQRWEVHQAFWSDIYKEAKDDDRFVGGDQWPEELKEKRKAAGRPILTYNLIPAFNRQITNRVRQGRPQVRAVAVERNKSKKTQQIANMAGTSDFSLADVLSGIIKNIEHISRADQAYDTAVKHAVDHGFGYFYLMPEWSHTDPFVQTLSINRVKNSYSITLDPEAQEADYRDSQDAFMVSLVKRKTFEKKWPKSAALDFGGVDDTGWITDDEIRVAQYFYIEHRDDEVVRLSNGRTMFWSDIADVMDDIEKSSGIHIVRDEAYKSKTNKKGEMRKKVKRPVCRWVKCSSKDVLEGPIDLPFSAVPIFIVTGEEMVVDGKVHYESAFRHAKDAQRSYNYWRTAAAETVALAPKAPYVLTPAQIKGHERMWETANEENHPYLLYNAKEGQSSPQRNYPTQVAAAELSQATQDGVDMQTIIGLHDASLGRNGNEKSGKAINARQAQGNTSTFQFPDNLNRALGQMGRLIVEAVPRLFDSERVERIRLPDDSEDFVALNTSIRDDETGKVVLVHDIAVGMYDVIMDTNASDYATQMQEAADLQMELLKVLGPQKADAIVHLIVKNLAVPGSEEVYRLLRKMLPDNLKTDEEKAAELPKGVTLNEQGQPVTEDGEPWQPEPTLDQQIQMQQQKVDQAKADAEMAKAQATTAKADADKEQAAATTAKAKADQAEAELEIRRLQTQQSTEQASEQTPGVDMREIQRIIQEAFQQHEQNDSAHKVAIEEQLSDAVVDALKRTKKYVDTQVRKMGQVPDGPTPRPTNEPGGSTSGR